jgi:DUF1680 family protein
MNTLTPHTLQAVALKEVVIDDPFWTPKLNTLRRVTLGDVFAKLEHDGALTNFDRVRDGQTGGHGGPPWYDGLLYETMRAAADMLAAHQDAALEVQMDGYIARIAAAADIDPNGYLNTFTQLEMPNSHFGLNDGKLLWQHDIYNAGALAEAAVHYYRATGKTTLLKVAARMTNHMADVMGPPPKHNIVPAHPLAEEAIIKLYRLFQERPALCNEMGFDVDDERYLHLVEFWLENRGNYAGRAPLSLPPQCGPAYAQDHLPLLKQETAEGHAVRAALLYAGLVSTAMVNQRADYYQAALKLWDNAVHRKMHITGSVGSNQEYEGFGPDYFLPNNAYLETCAAVAMGFFHESMALAFADGQFADELERTLYNGVLTGVSLKGDAYFYENPLESEGRERWAWHGCPCCPPMLLKILAALGNYIYAHDEQSIYLNLYVGSRTSLTLQGKTIHLSQVTNYPWEGDVAVTLDLSGSQKFEVALRVPGWCHDATLSVNGYIVDEPKFEHGYVRVKRAWRSGDVIELHLSMPVQRIQTRPEVEATRGMVALQRGPLIYAIEGIDQPGSMDIALPARPTLTDEHRRDLLGGITQIHGTTTQGAPLTAIPFYAIANRGKTPMRVWLKQAGLPNDDDTIAWESASLYRAMEV